MSDPRKRRTSKDPTGSPLLWVGGKKRLIQQILPVIGKPEVFVEAHVGSGALTFALLGQHQPRHIGWWDAVGPLLAFYRAIRRHSGEVCVALTKIQEGYPDGLDADAFREIREAFNQGRAAELFPSPMTAARFLIINRAGFNGLWRVNSAGGCNVPWGHWTLPPADWDSLRAHVEMAGRVLRRAPMEFAQWDARRQGYPVPVDPGTTIYVDPPYPGTYSGYDTPWDIPDYHAQNDRIQDWIRIPRVRVVVSFPAVNLDLLPPNPEIYPIRVADTVGGKSAPRGHREEVLAVYGAPLP